MRTAASPDPTPAGVVIAGGGRGVKPEDPGSGRGGAPPRDDPPAHPATGCRLSPLLSNVMLDDLDRELESRGHRFVRSADDTMVYVASQPVGERVMQGITQFVEQRLKLRVNRENRRLTRPRSEPFRGSAS